MVLLYQINRFFLIFNRINAAAGIAHCRLYELAGKLQYYGFDNVILHIGENVGYPDQRICRMTPQEAQEADPNSFFAPL